MLGVCFTLLGAGIPNVDKFTEVIKVTKDGAEIVIKEVKESTQLEIFSVEIPIKMTNAEITQIKNEVKTYGKEIEMLSKVIYQEWGNASDDKCAAVAWVILNRVDYDGYGDTITEVITAKNQFAWFEDTPILERHQTLARDVVTRWIIEKHGYENVGRTLPKKYLFFVGDGKENWFREKFNSQTFYDWSLKSPY